MKQKNSTKQLIFNAAAELISDRGFHAVSIQDIANKVGIRKSAIYNHYPSKEAILDELLDYYLQRMDVFYEQTHQLYTNLPVDWDLRVLLKQLIFYYEPEETTLMFHVTRIAYHEQFTSHKAADALMGNGYRKIVSIYEAFFDALTNAGYISSGDNNHMYAEMFARVSHSFAAQFLHPEFVYTIPVHENLLSFMIELIVNNEEEQSHAPSIHKEVL